ncbi:MAG: hypothetical protein JNG85_15730 [Spirochaetaceae bacterium]|nr:hypothetical protein [Spirochaetaceae bacterium]
MRTSPRAGAISPVFALAALLALVPAWAPFAAAQSPPVPAVQAAGAPPALSPSAIAAVRFPAYSPEGAPAVSPVDFDIRPPALAAAEYAYFRFDPAGAWIPFDRPLRLSAAPGEERAFRLETRVEGPAGARDASFGYRVDKRPPQPPRASPDPGLYRSPLLVLLAAEEGARLRYALLDQGTANPVFYLYDPARPPRLEPPAKGSATRVLVAYAEDSAGNRGAVRSFTYRLAERALAFDPPPPAAPAPAPVVDALAALGEAEIQAGSGRTSLILRAPEGLSLFAAVDPPDPLAPEAYAALPFVDGAYRLEMAVPYGFATSAKVHLALAEEGVLKVRAAAVELAMANAAQPYAPPPAPGEPYLVPGAPGGPSFLCFPNYPADLYVSLSPHAAPGAASSSTPAVRAAFEPYRAPLVLAAGTGSVELRYYGLGPGGRTETRSRVFPRAPALPEPRPVGVSDGALLSAAARLKASGPGVLRYELGRDGAQPKEPGASSPELAGELLVDCPAGEDHGFTLRSRAFSGDQPEAAAGEGGILSFRIDRRPPEAPRLLEAPPSHASESVGISLEAGEGLIFASISEDGAEGPFLPVSAPIVLSGSLERPVSYRVRAYARDEAGNASSRLETEPIIVDRATLYVEAGAPEGGDGTPERPLSSLEAAIRAAGTQGRRLLLLRGNFALAAPLRLHEPLEIRGGHGADWTRVPGLRSRIQLPAAPAGASQASLTVQGDSLRLSSLELVRTGGIGLPAAAGKESSATMLALEGATLRLEDCLLEGATKGDLRLLFLDYSRLEALGCEFSLLDARAGIAIAGRGGAIALSSSLIHGDAEVGYFTAIDLEGGYLAANDSRFAGRAELGASLLSLRSVRLEAARCLLEAKGGDGFLRLGRFESVSGYLASCRAVVDWSGDAVLFETVGFGPAFVHASVTASGGRFRFFDATGSAPVVRNSLLAAPAFSGSTLLRSSAAPLPGDLAANALSGFDSLVQGALELKSLKSLNAFNAVSLAFARKPNLEESPERSYAAAMKGLPRLSSSSACLGAGLPLAVAAGNQAAATLARGPGALPGVEAPPSTPLLIALARDFNGAARPDGKSGDPDIGADELSE